MPILQYFLYGIGMDVKAQEVLEAGIGVSKYIDSSYVFLMSFL